MSKPVIINWPVASTTAVCLLQTTAGAGSLLINGGLATTNTTVPTVAIFTNINRVVTLTSANNLSAVNVTITGYFQGAVVTETRTGPNANTVSTTQVFDSVTAVSVGAAVTALSVGTGTTGSTIWVLSDFYLPYNALTVGVKVTPAVNYTFQTTMDDVTTTASPGIFTPIDGVTIPTVPAATTMTAATVSIIANYTFPTRYSRILVNSSDATGTFTAYFLQQGLK